MWRCDEEREGVRDEVGLKDDHAKDKHMYILWTISSIHLKVSTSPDNGEGADEHDGEGDHEEDAGGVGDAGYHTKHSWTTV